MKEIWKDNPKYKYIEVSNYGRVKEKLTGRIIEPYKSNGSYVTIKVPDNVVSKGGYRNIKTAFFNEQGARLATKREYLHRLVCSTFHENIENKPEVNHRNEFKWCNCEWNLEWVTKKENINWGHGIWNKGLTKENDERVAKNAKATSEGMKRYWKGL